ncbi:MAG: Signal transduction histidine-protein kinase AtoS, partial [Euryarchaeota archaeon]|nr:Signal transduction histidine-protein kinase AtoS [Euryarchaeota archaeon]
MSVLLFSAFISGFLAYKAYLAFGFLKVRFSRYFILTLLCIFVWSVTYSGEIGFVDVEYKYACTMFQYLGISFLPAAWFLFSLEYSGNFGNSPLKLELLLLSFSALTFLVVNTNHLHWLYFTSYFLDNSNPFPIIVYEYGPLCWIYYSYSTFLILAALFFFYEQFLYSRFPFKSQAGVCIAGGILPLLGSMLHMGKVGPFSPIDLTPFLFSVFCLVIFWGIKKHEFLNLVPIARDKVIESMKDGYMVVDEDSRVIDINPVALGLAGQTESYDRIKSLDELFGDKFEAFSGNGEEDAFQKVISSEKDLQNKYFKPGVSSLRLGRFGKCRLIMLHDITETYAYGEALKDANEKINFMSSITRHDLLNQINMFSFWTKQLSKKIPEEYRDDPTMGKYLHSLRKGTEIIHQQLIFTRDYQDIGVMSPVWQSVNEVAKEAAFSFSNYGVKFFIQEGDFEVYADPLLRKVYYNLFHNALTHGEKVSEISVYFYQQGETAIIEVKDNGIGIPSDMKKTIFKKGVGKNIGLGLFLLRSILSIT